MTPLPFITDGLDLPPEQPVIVGTPHDYVGIYALDDEPRIVVSLKNVFLQSGRVENWNPVFECEFPITIAPSERKERFFQIRFTGIPGERDQFVTGKLCVRSVRVIAIQKMFEGENPPIFR
jgi:hypothetical protein